MDPIKRKKTSEEILEILKQRSGKGLEFARRTILAEKLVCEKIWETLKYYTARWENFTHPGLISIACEAVGGNPDKAVEVQAAIAMIASALDLHDDIIDRSKIKHGKQTVLGKYGEDMALILGDVFLVSGFALLNKSVAKLPEEQAKEIYETLERSLLELGSAHALESNLKGRMDTAPEEYMQILEMKAVSVEADMHIGAIIGGGTDSKTEALTKYGRILGTLATLREEFIDIFEIRELRQRTQNECLPIPILYALKNEKPKKIQKILSKKRMTNKDVDKLLDIVFETSGVKGLKKEMGVLIQEALQLTSNIRNQDVKILLDKLATSALEDL
jgi:geranylgeranyl pyrophosphate synthase